MEHESQRPAEEPRHRFAILVEGGVVQTVISAGEHVDIDLFTREATFPYWQPRPDAHLQQDYDDRQSGYGDW